MALTGNASDTQLTDAQQAALRDAIASLGPHDDHPGIGGIVEQLNGVASATDEDDDRLEKALGAVRMARVELSKSADVVDPLERIAVDQRLAKAEHELQHEIAMAMDTGGYSRVAELRKAKEGHRAAVMAGIAA